MRRYLEPAPAEPNTYVLFLSRCWWVLVLVTLVGISATAAYALLGPTTYRSTATVLVPSDPTASGGTQGSPGQVRTAAQNYAAQATTPLIFDLLSSALSRRQISISSRELTAMGESGRLSVQAASTANIIRITANAEDPNLARSLADTMSAVFVDSVNGGTGVAVQQTRQRLSEQIEVTRLQLATAELYQRQDQLSQQLRAEQEVYVQTLQLLNAPEGNALGSDPALRAQLNQTVRQQEQQIQQRISNLEQQLTEVQIAIEQSPTRLDPALATALANAYRQQLTDLSRSFVHLEVQGPAGGLPLQRYGDASEPLPAGGMKTLLIVGGGATVAAALAIAYLMEILSRRRSGRAANGQDVSHGSVPALAAPREARPSTDGRNGRRRRLSSAE